MKKYLPLFLCFPFYTASLMAAMPHGNQTISDFVENAKNLEHVYEIQIKFSHATGRCSAVQVQTESMYSLFLTAAHCLINVSKGKVATPNRIVLKGNEASHYFLYPAFDAAPQYDLAAFIVPKAVKGGWPLYVGSPESLLREHLIHAGFGKIPDHSKMPLQAFQVYPSQVSSVLLQQSPFQNTQLLGSAGYGDSGGPLLVKPNHQIAAIFTWLYPVGSEYMNYWTIIPPAFEELIAHVFSMRIPQKGLINLTEKGRSYWLTTQKDGATWSQVKKQLQEDPETQFYLGAAALLDENPKNSIPWFTKALENKVYEAAHRLGDLYVSQNKLKKAFTHYMIAADAGLPHALLMVGKFYYLGQGGVEKNVPKAIEFMEGAQRKGLAGVSDDLKIAYYQEGMNYYDSDNFYKAAAYYKKAALLGHLVAAQELEKIKSAINDLYKEQYGYPLHPNDFEQLIKDEL